MSKKNPLVTPKSKIKAAIRRLWLYSRERASAIQRDKYTCQGCGKKQSRAIGKEFSVEVHHKNGINWDAITDLIRTRVLQTPDDLITLCDACHGEIHEKESNEIDSTNGVFMCDLDTPVRE